MPPPERGDTGGFPPSRSAVQLTAGGRSHRISSSIICSRPTAEDLGTSGSATGGSISAGAPTSGCPTPGPVRRSRPGSPASLAPAKINSQPLLLMFKEKGDKRQTKPHLLLFLPSQPLSVTRGIGKNKRLHKVHRFHAVPSVLIKYHCHFYLLKILPPQSARSAHVGTI